MKIIVLAGGLSPERDVSLMYPYFQEPESVKLSVKWDIRHSFWMCSSAFHAILIN